MTGFLACRLRGVGMRFRVQDLELSFQGLGLREIMEIRMFCCSVLVGFHWVGCGLLFGHSVCYCSVAWDSRPAGFEALLSFSRLPNP